MLIMMRNIVMVLLLLLAVVVAARARQASGGDVVVARGQRMIVNKYLDQALVVPGGWVPRDTAEAAGDHALWNLFYFPDHGHYALENKALGLWLSDDAESGLHPLPSTGERWLLEGGEGGALCVKNAHTNEYLSDEFPKHYARCSKGEAIFLEALGSQPEAEQHPEIRVHVYKLSLCSRCWHSEVEVDGEHYFFHHDSRVHSGSTGPGVDAAFHRTIKRKARTSLADAVGALNGVRREFERSRYNVFTNNCNFFADAVLRKLTGDRLDTEYMEHSGMQDFIGGLPLPISTAHEVKHAIETGDWSGIPDAVLEDTVLQPLKGGPVRPILDAVKRGFHGDWVKQKRKYSDANRVAKSKGHTDKLVWNALAEGVGLSKADADNVGKAWVKGRDAVTRPFRDAAKQVKKFFRDL